MEQYSLSLNVENAGNAGLHLVAVDKTSVYTLAQAGFWPGPASELGRRRHLFVAAIRLSGTSIEAEQILRLAGRSIGCTAAVAA